MTSFGINYQLFSDQRGAHTILKRISFAKQNF